MTEQQELAKAISIALELIRLQHSEIEWLKTTVFALRDSVASGKPPLPLEDAQRQVFAEMRESGQNVDDILPLLNQHLERIWELAK